MKKNSTLCYERIALLREEQGLTIKHLSNLTDIPERTILSWKTQMPGGENLITISKFFRVSIDYILGISNHRGSLDHDDVKVGKELELFEFLDSLTLSDKQYDILLRTVKGITIFRNLH